MVFCVRVPSLKGGEYRANGAGVQAARELNQLRGVPRAAAAAWLADARAVLEARQALAVCRAHAALAAAAIAL